jgi:hypothetical protein
MGSSASPTPEELLSLSSSADSNPGSSSGLEPSKYSDGGTLPPESHVVGVGKRNEATRLKRELAPAPARVAVGSVSDPDADSVTPSGEASGTNWPSGSGRGSPPREAVLALLFRAGQWSSCRNARLRPMASYGM